MIDRTFGNRPLAGARRRGAPELPEGYLAPGSLSDSQLPREVCRKLGSLGIRKSRTCPSAARPGFIASAALAESGRQTVRSQHPYPTCKSHDDCPRYRPTQNRADKFHRCSHQAF
jgi:hypothetical protein